MTDDPDDSFPAEPNPFDAFETPAEIFAYLFRKEGESALRELMSMPIKGVTRTREDLLDDAAELKSAGLTAVAAIVTDLSSGALPMTDMSFCRYSPDVPANVAAWLRSTQRRQLERQAEKNGQLRDSMPSRQ
jgi:hypothetical protein